MSKPQLRTAKDHKHVLFSIVFTGFLNVVSMGIVFPILAPMFLASDTITIGGLFTGIDPNIILGILLMAYPAAQFIGAPILGDLADRYGRRPTLILSILGTLVSYLLFGYGILSDQLWLLFAARLFDGFTGGNVSVAYAVIADISNDKTRTRNFGLVGMAFGLGFLVGPLLGGVLSEPEYVSWFNFATPFWFAAFMALINVIFVYYWLPETNPKKTVKEHAFSPFTGFRNLAKAWQFSEVRTLLLVILILTLGFNFFTLFFPVFLTEKFGFDQSAIGLFFTYVGIFVVITQGGLVPVVGKYLKEVQVLRYFPILLAISLALLIVPDHSSSLFYIMPLIAFSHGILMPNYNSLVSELTLPEHQGEMQGINQSIQALGMAIPPAISGFLTANNQDAAMLSAGIVTAIGWLVFLLLFCTEPQR